MGLEGAQHEMRVGYTGGSTGVLVSGLVWLAAGITIWHSGISAGFTVLFLGGVLIFPLSMLLSRLLFSALPVSGGNPLNRLAIESTVMLFIGLLIGWALLKVQPDLAFPVIALAIGARYATFRTLYDEWMYWLLGGAIIAIGALGLLDIGGLRPDFVLLIGIVEVVFAVLIFLRWRKTV